MNKSQLRARLRQEQVDRKYEDTVNISNSIATKAIDFIDWDDIKTMHCYTSISQRGEVASWDLLEHVWINYPKIQVFTPAKPKEDYSSGYLTNKDTQFFEDNIGLSYPDYDPTPLPQLDLVIVPMLGFNRKLYRLGQGGGFYDRMLKAQTHALKVGLAWEESLIAGLQVEDHDVPMDVIITQKHIRTRKQ